MCVENGAFPQEINLLKHGILCDSLLYLHGLNCFRFFLRESFRGMSNQEKLRERLQELKAEHRDVDDAIIALSQRAVPDMIQLQRLKKKKLLLKDEIKQLESQILPDIIA